MHLTIRSSEIKRRARILVGRFQVVEAVLFSILFSAFIVSFPITGSRNEFHRDLSGPVNRGSGELGEQIGKSNYLLPQNSNGNWNQILDWSQQIQRESE